jgi:hypothetical protein
MSLEIRQQKFSLLEKQFKCERPSPLFLIHKIDEELYESLRLATCIYMSKSMGLKRPLLTEEAVMEKFVELRESVQNMTPNGMLVPKRHLILEFNAVVKAFVDIIATLKIEQFISSWHVPLNVRFKDGEMAKENMGRKFATENIHSDSWAGESAESATIMIPLFGDLARNHMTFYEPPLNFEESWLGPKDSYADGEGIAAQYKKIDLQQQKGYLYLSDFATLHASSRLPGAGPRASIDTTFALKRLATENIGQEVIHPWRESERLDPKRFANIGLENLFLFPNRIGENVDSSKGFKHPTELQVIDFNLDSN